jgi:type IV secretory pathway TrbD component
LTEEVREHRGLRTDSPPPASEDIHLPGPSYVPIVTAAGIAIAIVGLVLSSIAFAIGVVILVVALAIWIRSARQEMAELPLEHG